VLGVYVAGSRLIAGQTPGTALVNRLAGSRAPTRRPAISALVPALLVALLVSFLVGRAVPVGATESPSGSGGGTAVSPQPSFSPPAPQPSPTVDPQTQAVAVDQVLHSSTASRAKLKAALTTLDGCHDAAAAATDLTEVASERSAQLSQASVLVLDQLPGGTEIRAALVEALTHSVAADQDFVAWGQQVAAGHCGHDANYQAGLDASKTAQDAKKRFCAAWNPVAATYGLPQRTQADI
jgi:hypothetical protein